MSLPNSILIAAALIAGAVFLTGLYDLRTGSGGAYRINTVTGAMLVCAMQECRPAQER